MCGDAFCNILWARIMERREMTQFNLLGISGSLRAASFNRMLIREAGRLMQGATYTEADLDLPLYNGDVEEAEGIPAAVQTWRTKLRRRMPRADSVLA